jgi:Holliday junction resolvase
MRRLRSEGWLCSRSAASHGPVDIFAAKEGKVLLIQVKSGKGRLSPTERETLLLWSKAYQARAEVWFFKKRTTEKLLIFDAKKNNLPESSSQGKQTGIRSTIPQV